VCRGICFASGYFGRGAVYRRKARKAKPMGIVSTLSFLERGEVKPNFKRFKNGEQCF
jgi:hypothetical protein